MKFETLDITNFKSISNESVQFESGIIVIQGQNGAGKSNFLEAAFFALYGSKALPSHSNLEDVIKNGEDKTKVELTFTHDGGTYVIERSLRQTGNGSPNHNCSFKTEDGEQITSVTRVENRIEELLRMDATSFLNCAYVRQGEIKLVEASPGEREEMIDRLLQLGVLEDYRERASKVRLGVKNARENKSAVLDDVTEDIEALEQENLESRIARLSDAIDDLEAKKEEHEEDLEETEEKMERVDDEIDNLEDYKERIAELEGSLETVEAKIEQDEDKRSAKEDELEEHRERREDLLNNVNDELARTAVDVDSVDEIDGGADVVPAERYDTTPLDNALEKAQEERNQLAEEVMDKRDKKRSLEGDADQLRDKASMKQSRVDEKKNAAKAAEKKAEEVEQEESDLRDEIGSIDEEIENLEDELRSHGYNTSMPVKSSEEELNDVESDLQEVKRQLESLRDDVREAENLLEEGKCPECGQPVDDSPHVEGLEEKRERIEKLEDELATLEEECRQAEKLVEEAESLQEARERREGLEEECEELEAEADEHREEATEHREEAAELEAEADDLKQRADEKEDEAARVRGEIKRLEENTDEIDDRIAVIESAIDSVNDLVGVEKDIQHAVETRESIQERLEEREERLTTIKDDLLRYREKYDEERLEEARKRRQSLSEDISGLKEEIETVDGELSDRRTERARVEEKLNSLNEKRDKRDRLEEEVERLRDAQEQAEEMEEMYETLRRELREKNVLKLEQVFNEVFMDLYQNDTYESIELTNDYEITIHDKVEGELSPQMLSGGEKVMFNLALRCAIYQLLAEASSESDPSAPNTLPPLILDEPTAHLDDAHVTQLSEVVSLMRQLGVDQTVVVSHQEEIVASSDVTFDVSLNSTTNSSSIERQRERDNLLA